MGIPELPPDRTLERDARDMILLGAGEHPCSEEARSLGFDRCVVQPFSRAAIDVWYYKPCDPDKCQSFHHEFGRIGGEVVDIGGVIGSKIEGDSDATN